jgi:hypothetical protein
MHPSDHFPPSFPRAPVLIGRPPASSSIVPIAFEVRAGAHEGYALVHDPLAHAQVAIHPLADFLVLGERGGIETGAA